MAADDQEDGPRSKRPAILRAAVELFGELGFEHAKWSAVAERVGIGQTALYHYFESKAHCLLTIMRIELDQSRERFRVATEGLPPEKALAAAVRSAYEVSESEALQIRVLHSNFVMLANPRLSEREESARRAARALVHQIEEDWTGLLQAGMDDGSYPARDPKMMAQAVLGLIVSVWRWYRPGRGTTLAEITELIEGCVMRMVGDGPA